MTMLVRPSDDCELIELMPEIVDSCRSIGAANEEAMVSALAPGNVAVIEMVGKWVKIWCAWGGAVGGAVVWARARGGLAVKKGGEKAPPGSAATANRR